ncbi:hypothetical protein KJ756_02965 [Patescibacteria group bacterium]|nr:hypothetical protein [Patescibacteria group bacterium]MBU4031090.1 hypothetical protein [Patescibacteria group bacterium]
MKVIIQDIPQEFVGPVRIRHLEEKGIVICYKGNKIDLEIDDQKLSERILREQCNFVF